MTLVVLALDGLDAAQVDHFGLDSLRLASSGELETFAHEDELPHTLEVWPTVATGVGPDEHGLSMSGSGNEWSNPLVNLASNVVGPRLNFTQRERLGKLVSAYTGSDWSISETEAPSMFDAPGRVVHNWPGVHRSTELRRAWRAMEAVSDDEIGQQEFDRRIWGLAAEQFGWLEEMLNHPVTVAGVHVHVLDVAGHVYGTDEERYRVFHEHVCEMVDRVTAAMGSDDDMLLLSDHGITTPWTDDGDDRTFRHSWRAYSATTRDDRPESVFDVREWVEHVAAESTGDDRSLDVPKERLRQLGYVE